MLVNDLVQRALQLRSCWLLLALALVAHAASAVQAPPRFDAVGDAAAIPQSVVSALAQDHDGRLWIGTGAGLVRYDGYSFRSQTLSVGKEGGPALRGLGFVRSILVARDGRLWVGTESDGLAVLDPRSEQLQVFRSNPADAGALAPGTIRGLAEDRDGKLWIGTIGHGLDRFDPATGRFEHFRKTDLALGLLDDRIQALLVDSQGTLWVGNWSGLQRRRAGESRFEPVAPSLKGQIVTSLIETSDGHVWVGSQQGGLSRLARGSGEELPLDSPASGNGAVHSFVELEGGLVWVGRASGIERRAAGGKLLAQIKHERLSRSGLASNEVRALLRDRAGWVWVGSYGGGLQRHNPLDTGIWVRGPEGDSGAVFEEPNARSLLQLDNGEVWVGTGERGLAVMDAGLRLIGELRPGERGFAGRRVAGLAQTRDGRVWVGSDAGLYEMNRERRVLRHLHAGSGRVRRLLAGSDGSLWIGTQDGLFRWHKEQLVRLEIQGGAALTGDVNGMAESPDGGLWVGTEKGLFWLARGASQLLPVAERKGAGLGHPTVLGLLMDRRGWLWIDTAVGLHLLKAWDGKAAAFERISEAQGRADRAFGANLLEDSRGRIWTQQQVYDPDKKSVYELTAADGADHGTGWFRSYAALADGRLLFGGSKGLLVVEPERFRPWDHAPPLVVSELRIDGRPRQAGDLLEGLTLQPGQRGFSVEFAALDFSDPARSQYEYRLQGYDADWLRTGASYRVAAYSNLSPGLYTLQVRATNRAGVWSSHELAIPIEVLPAWWQQLWFRLLAGLAALAAVAGVVQLRTQMLQRRQLELEQRVQERTAELEAVSMALKESSLTDPLTGLRNRRFLVQHIEAEVAMTVRRHETALRRGEPAPADGDLIFFLIDIDHFKRVNDEHGHAAGDAALTQMRGRLEPVFRATDWLVRWGGEEFLIVARSTSRQHAVELAERVRAAVAGQPFVLDDGRQLARSCSLGFACFPLAVTQPRALDWSATLDLADAALYTAKRSGRNAWAGVVDAGNLDEAALHQRGSSAEWLASGELPLLSSS